MDKWTNKYDNKIVYLFIHPCYLSIYPSMLSIYPSMLSIHPSMLATYLSIHPSIHAIYLVFIFLMPSYFPRPHLLCKLDLSWNIHFSRTSTESECFNSNHQSAPLRGSMLFIEDSLSDFEKKKWWDRHCHPRLKIEYTLSTEHIWGGSWRGASGLSRGWIKYHIQRNMCVCVCVCVFVELFAFKWMVLVSKELKV